MKRQLSVSRDSYGMGLVNEGTLSLIMWFLRNKSIIFRNWYKNCMEDSYFMDNRNYVLGMINLKSTSYKSIK